MSRDQAEASYLVLPEQRSAEAQRWQGRLSLGAADDCKGACVIHIGVVGVAQIPGWARREVTDATSWYNSSAQFQFLTSY